VGKAERITKTQELVYEMRVADVMTRCVITVGPQDRMSALRGILRKNRISGVPVVEGERLVGLVSLEDFIKWLADRQDDCPIESKMTRQLETLYDDEPLVRAIGKFERLGLGRFPVLDRQQGKLVGILTKGDVIEGLLKKLEIDYHDEQAVRHRASHIFEDIEADSTTLVFEYRIRGNDFRQAGTSSSRLKRTLKRLGLRPDLVRRVAIASYEAEMNLVIFTEGGTIRARVQPQEVFLEAEDAGPGIPDLQQALQPGFSTAPEWVRELGFGAGMGLPNIQRCADRFDIRSQPGQGTFIQVAFVANGNNHDAG